MRLEVRSSRLARVVSSNKRFDLFLFRFPRPSFFGIGCGDGSGVERAGGEGGGT